MQALLKYGSMERKYWYLVAVAFIIVVAGITFPIVLKSLASGNPYTPYAAIAKADGSDLLVGVYRQPGKDPFFIQPPKPVSLVVTITPEEGEPLSFEIPDPVLKIEDEKHRLEGVLTQSAAIRLIIHFDDGTRMVAYDGVPK
jgi:hypothetical protein